MSWIYSTFSSYLQLAGRPAFAKVLASRLSSEEIEEFVTSFTKLLRRHISEDEYHALFLAEQGDTQSPSREEKA